MFRDHNKHFKFYRDLAVNLMKRCQEQRDIISLSFLSESGRPNLIELVSDLTPELHQKEKGRKQSRCKACQAAGRIHTQSRKRRKPLLKRSDLNLILDLETGESFSRHDVEPLRPTYRCSTCNISLCNEEICWQEHIEAVEQRRFQQNQAQRYASPEFLEETDGLDDDFGWNEEYQEYFYPIPNLEDEEEVSERSGDDEMEDVEM